MIANSGIVINHFGYWPSFCDARIEAINYSLPGTIELTLFYIDSDKNKSAHIALRFSGVAQLELNGLCSDNVIDELVIQAGKPLSVQLVGAYGLSGSFSCSGAEVVHSANA